MTLGGNIDTGILIAPCFGVQMSFLRMRDTTPVSVADITATVEEVAGKVTSLRAPACMQPYTCQLSRCVSAVAASHTLHMYSPDAVTDVTLPPSPQGQVLFIRLYDAEGSDLAVGQQKDAASRVQALSKVQ